MSERAPVLPALLSETDAARYLGVSTGTLRKLDLPRKVLGARRLYHRHDLDAFADDLPYEGERNGGPGCDASEVFG